MAKAPPSIAATSTLAMVRTAEARGFRATDVLEAAGLTREFLDDPDSRIPGPTVLGIWNALRERTGDPALQLVAPVSLPFGAYRVIDYLVGASETVGDGIIRFARFFRLIAEAVSLTVEHDGRPDGVDDTEAKAPPGPGAEHWLCLATADGGPVPPVYVDYVFAALVSRIRMRIRPGLRVGRVGFRQPMPASAASYAAVFRAPIEFGAAEDRLCFSDVEWNARMDTADSSLAVLLEEHAKLLAERLPQVEAGFRAEVQQAIAAALPDGGSADVVARKLCVSVRTLQRKLVATGTTFRELSESVREQLAEEYLADPNVSIAEVAFMLGFSDQSSFNRAFCRWTGEAPGRWRRKRAGKAVSV